VQTEIIRAHHPENSMLKKKSQENKSLSKVESKFGRSSISPATSPQILQMRRSDAKQKPHVPHKGPIGRIKHANKNDEDLSAILKDIQLPNMDEPSCFSDVSGIKSLELQEFNDESFGSGR